MRVEIQIYFEDGTSRWEQINVKNLQVSVRHLDGRDHTQNGVPTDGPLDTTTLSVRDGRIAFERGGVMLSQFEASQDFGKREQEYREKQAEIIKKPIGRRR